jgi:hypothetical protein
LLKEYENPQDVLGCLVIFQQFIEQFASDGHVLLPFSLLVLLWVYR